MLKTNKLIYITALEIFVFTSFLPINDKVKEITVKTIQHILLIRMGKSKRKSIKIDTLKKHKIAIEIFVYLDSCFNIFINHIPSLSSILPHIQIQE